MKATELITDYAIEIVFENTNFGDIPAREIVEKNLIKIKDGWDIGHTARCCLIELGLIYETTKRDLVLSKIGNMYLRLLPAETELQASGCR